MTDHELRQELEQTYELVCFANLADIGARHSEVYQLFSQHCQEEYQPNQRLIFYSSEEPSQKLLDHIQKEGSDHNISNWFIVFCTPWDITAKLESANQRYGFDAQVMRHQQVTLNYTGTIIDSSIVPVDVRCVMPFHSLDVDIDGAVRPCCKYVSDISQPADQNLMQTFTNGVIANIREQFRQGNRIKDCDVCWDKERQGLPSHRHIMSNMFSDLKYQTLYDNPELQFLSISPSNICNFKCRICNSRSSSAIAVEELQQKTYKSTLKINLNRRSQNGYDNILKLVNGCLDHLEFLHILGGEPLMMKGITEALTHIVDSGHSNHITIVFNTNGSVWNQKIVDFLQKFQKVRIQISIDDVGPRFEIQRGGVWEAIDANVRKYVALIQPERFEVILNPTVNIQNILYLDELFDYAKELNVGVGWQFLRQPESLNIDCMTPAAVRLVKSKFAQSPYESLRDLAAGLVEDPTHTGKNFVEYMNKLDSIRAQNFAQSHPEIFQAMSQVP
jgi:MoaA/NifB/PqqE/SkfB family radical SAM enzyme